MSSENVDRLSMLPDEIRSQVLSRMPTIFAARTTILSKRWKNSWMLITNIDFDDDVHPITDLYSFIRFVGRVFDQCKPSHVNFVRLRLLSWLPKSIVSNLIVNSVKLDVHELDLHFYKLPLPLSLFTCKSLTKLRLQCRRVNDLDLCGRPVNLPCLKTLDMIGLKSSFADILKFISGCPLLENLSFEVGWRSYGTRYRLHTETEDYIFNAPTLKRLKITLESCAFHANKVVLNIPNLEYLFVGGALSAFIVMEDVSSLVEASVSFSDIRSVDHHHRHHDHHHYHHHPWVELLKGVSRVKSLSVRYNPSVPSTSFLPNFSHTNHLKLKSYWNSIQIFHFLEKSPELQHLFIEKIEFPCWIKPKRVPPCMLTKLTTINLSICFGQKWEIEFLEYMLGIAKGLKTVTITWGEIQIAEEVRWREQLLAFPRASGCCEILFLGGKAPSSTVDTMDDDLRLVVKRIGRCGGSSFDTTNHDVC